MLLNDFYTIHDVREADGNYTCLVKFNAAHDIFKGHFPAQPVVPGVCMMYMVKELLQQRVGKKLHLNNAGNIKFLQLITPEVAPVMHIKWSSKENGYQVSASFKLDDADLFKLVGHYDVVN